MVEKGAGLEYLKVQTETTNFTKKIPDKLPNKNLKTKPNVDSEYDQEDEDLKSFIANELKVIEQKEQAEKAGSSKAPQSSKRKSNKRRPSSPVANTSKKSAYSIPYIPPKSTHPKSYGQYEFQEDEHGFVHVYTDGSCINNGQKNPSAGLGVYFGEDHPLNASQPVKGRPTNNVGEIQASILAIRLASKHGIEKLMLLTDSQFLIHSICVWLPGWKRKGWKLATGENVKNRAEFEELDNLIERTDMCIKWVIKKI